MGRSSGHFPALLGTTRAGIGAATATFGLLGQGSARTGATSGGAPTSAAYTAFNKAQWSITRGGSALRCFWVFPDRRDPP